MARVHASTHIKMPSKNKKHSKTPIKLSFSDQSSPSSTPPPKINEEDLSHSLLEEASIRFPSLISKDAFIGTIADVQSNNGSPTAQIWLSDSAMVSSSLVPGSIVSVSLSSSEKEHLCGSPLKSLIDQRGQHCNVDASDDGSIRKGTYFALALVFPSCKVSKNAVRLSWSLACTMGNPDLGKIAFVCPIQTSSMAGFSNGSNKLQYTLETSNSGLSFCNCKDLYLEVVPSMYEVSIISNSTSEPHRHQLENRNSLSPRTPSSYKLQPNPRQVSNMTKGHDSVSNIDYMKEIPFGTHNVEKALANEKSRELLQTCASLWLRVRYLLPGNRVAIPMGGQISVFDVLNAEPLSIECPCEESANEGKYVPSRNAQTFNLDHLNCAFVMNHKTKVHINLALPLVSETPDRRGFTPVHPDRGKTKNTTAGHVIKLGGLSKEYNILKDIISSLSMKGPLISWGLKPMKGVLLHGPPGTGKTSLARSCAFDAGIELFEVNGPEIIGQFHGESEQALHEIFDSASKASPAAVFIDELDAIAPARKDGGDELSQRLVATLLNLMDGISGTEGVLVIATTNRPDSIDPALRRPGRLEREIEIGVPSPRQRLDVLQSLLNGMDHTLLDSQIQYLASVTHGYVGADLALLCDQAALGCLKCHVKSTDSNYSSAATNGSVQLKEPFPKLNGCSLDLKISSGLSSVNRHNPTDSVSSDLSAPAESALNCHSDPETQHVDFELQNVDHISSENVTVESNGGCCLKISFEHFEVAMRKVRPSAMREIILEIPKVRWGDVGGQMEIKQQLKEAVEWPRKHHEDCQRIGTRPPTGLLLYGPPGCSKTLMARAVASEAGLNFLSVKGPELFSKWVGESEKAVKTLFAKARANAPSIIFFDEIDGLAVIRGVGNDGASVSDRVISQLLVEMDGLHTRVDVTVIAATNRPDKIDPALLRPGRFDRLLYVGPPSEADREDIFRIHVRGKPCGPDVSIKELARLTDGCTGADIALICREAGLAAIAESLDDASEVSMKHFRSGIERVQPSKVRYDQDFGSKFQRFVRSGKRIDDSGNKPGSTTHSTDIRSLCKSSSLGLFLTTCIFAPCSFFVAKWIHQHFPLILYDKHG